MNIVHVFHHFSPCTGGIETVIEKMCEQSVLLGDGAGVVCLNKCPNSGRVLPEKGNIGGIAVERIPFLDLRYYKVAPGVLGKLGGADIVHVHGLGFFSDFLALTKPVHRKRLVLSTHGGIFHSGKGGLFKRIYFYIWARIALMAFDRVLAVSRQDLGLFGKIVPGKKLGLVENGVDLKRFSGLGGKRKKGQFLFVGRLSRNKQLEKLLEAFALACKKNRVASLVVAGQDFENLQENLVERAKELGIENRVSFRGEVSDEELLRLYSESEFFASASSYEGFGITAIEAMAAGLVPILNRIPTFERFAGEGRGIPTDFSDAKEGAKAMIAALEMPERKKDAMRKKNLDFCRAFSWEKKGKELRNVYSRILAGKREELRN